MKLRTFIILQFLTFLSCCNGVCKEDYEKLIIGKWQLDSIHSENGEKQNIEVFLPYLEFNTRRELTIWGIEDHKKVDKYTIKNSNIYFNNASTETDSIIKLDQNKMDLLVKISAKNPDGSAFLQIDTHYYTRKK